MFGSWVTEATPAQRRRIQDHTADIMAAIHAIEVDERIAGVLARPEFGDTPLTQHLAHQRWYYDWARDGVDFPLIEEALEWLEARRPADDPIGVNWGDARIGNILFDVDGDLSPVAVVDWEMACLGAPEADVAWQLMLHHFFCDIAAVMGMDDPMPDFLRVEDFVARYEATAGRRLRHLEWYYVFDHLRFAIISLRTSRRAVASGDMAPPDDPQDLVSNARILRAALAGTNPYWER
ncbi:MAG: phosphotransferase family protein [Actinomyces sp.]|nr:MAG: phosphotransferase family protein [Actinomyces sp.]